MFSPHPIEILLVDDDMALMRLLEIALRPQGFIVRIANEGQKAVEIYRQYHDSVAVVLLDVQMPGMDGPETLTALRRINPEIRAAFMSGDAGRYSLHDLLAIGASQFFEKPFRSLAEVGILLRQLAMRETLQAV